MNDLAILSAENEMLRGALTEITDQCANSGPSFKERLGDRSFPTWYAVNQLQYSIAAAEETARRALGGQP